MTKPFFFTSQTRFVKGFICLQLLPISISKTKIFDVHQDSFSILLISTIVTIFSVIGITIVKCPTRLILTLTLCSDFFLLVHAFLWLFCFLLFLIFRVTDICNENSKFFQYSRRPELCVTKLSYINTYTD